MSYFPLPGNQTTTGTLTASAAANAAQSAATAVQITVPDQHSSWSVYLKGTFSATSQVYFEGSETGLDTDWFNLNGRRNSDAATNDSTNFLNTNTLGGAAPTGGNPSHWRGNTGGIKYFRVRCHAFTTADSINVTIVSSNGVGTTFLNSPITIAGLITPAVKTSTVGTSAVQIDTQQADRKAIEIKSLSTNTGIIYVGFSSGVTTVSTPATAGRELTAGDSWQIDLNPAFPVYAIASATSQTVQVTEIA